MDIQLNRNIEKVETSEIRQFNDYARSVGANVILTLGEPDFHTPQAITTKAIKALEAHQTKYGPTLGFLDLRKKIVEFEKRVNDFSCTPEEIIITHGSTEGLTSALFTMLNPGDEVIIPIPAYPMYRQMIEFMGGKVVPIDTTLSKFQITENALLQAILLKRKPLF